jgi:hypothetical protein
MTLTERRVHSAKRAVMCQGQLQLSDKLRLVREVNYREVKTAKVFLILTVALARCHMHIGKQSNRFNGFSWRPKVERPKNR